jgi:hypothetical protein
LTVDSCGGRGIQIFYCSVKIGTRIAIKKRSPQNVLGTAEKFN